MTAFDYAVLAVIAASVLLGLWRGVVSEVLALAAWVVAFFVARTWGVEVAAWLAPWVVEPGMRLAAAYVLVFVGVLLGFALARLLISLMLKAVTRAEIAGNDYSLTPGRYVGVAAAAEGDEEDFAERMREIQDELAELNEKAGVLAARIAGNFEELLG